MRGIQSEQYSQLPVLSCPCGDSGVQSLLVGNEREEHGKKQNQSFGDVHGGQKVKVKKGTSEGMCWVIKKIYTREGCQKAFTGIFGTNFEDMR